MTSAILLSAISLFAAFQKFLKETESTTPMNTRVIRKWHNLIADTKKVLMVWIEDQTNHNIPLSQGLIHNKALILFNSMKVEKGKAAAQERSEASRGCFMMFKKISHLHKKMLLGLS